ncbi:MAG: 50S ribosomal protein L1 [Candidatus Nanohaloarchaea archaeon]
MTFKDAIQQAIEEGEDRNFTEAIDLIINVTDLELDDPENRFNEDIKLPFQADEEVKVGVIGDTLLNNTEEADIEVTESELEEMFDEPSKAKDLAEEASFLIAEAPLMPKIGQHLGQVFGPRNMMPDPMQPGEDPTETIESLRNTVTLRLKEEPLLQVKIGNEEQDTENIARNAETVYDFVESEMPQGQNNIKSVLIKTTMGPTTEVDA